MLNEALAILKSLESYGYTEREVTIGDVKIKLAPLCSGETVEVFETSNKYDDADASIQVLKIETLARSIISVNDYKFNPKKFVNEKREIILAFGDEIIDIIFSEYCILDKTIINSIERKGSSVISRLETIAETE